MGDPRKETGQRNAAVLSGQLVATQINEYPAVQVIAGAQGCWFFLDVQAITVPSIAALYVPFVFRTYPNLAAAPVMQAPTFGVIEPVPFKMDPAKTLLTRMLVGGSQIDIAAGFDLPHAANGDIPNRANGFFHSGPRRFRPSQWLAPGNVFHVQGSLITTGIRATSLYHSALFEEPVSGV